MTTTEPAGTLGVPAGSFARTPHAKRPRWWLAAIAIAWGLVLAVGAIVATRHGAATDREQTTVAQARPVVDSAAARVATAAAQDGLAIASISDFVRVGDCAISLVRAGERYQRDVTVVVAPGTEAALLQRIASRLPASYHPTVRSGAVPRLVADAGFWVSLLATVISPGEVRFVADTGSCRARGDLGASTSDSGVASPALSGAFAALRLTPSDVHQYAVACPGGGTLRTLTARGGAYPGALDAVLRDVPGATAVVATPRLYAYQVDAAGLTVNAADDATTITATTPCG